MKWFLTLLKSIWWAMVAYLPFAIHDITMRYSKFIGCPPRGDCYKPGSELLFSMDVLTIGTAILLWPPCFWFLGGGLVIKRIVKGFCNIDFNDQQPNL